MGKKTLFLLTLKWLAGFLVLLLVIIICFITLAYIPKEQSGLIFQTIAYSLILDILLFLLGAFIGWLEYIHYRISVGEKSIQVTTGIISEEQKGIPYRRIKEVKISRSLFDQIVGTSTIHITTLGSDNELTSHDETQTILPVLPKQVATQIQGELLRRAQVEEMSFTQPKMQI